MKLKISKKGNFLNFKNIVYKNSKVILTFTFFILFVYILTTKSFALGEPQIVQKLENSFEKIESWVLKLATPAAAIAVATGIFIQKFSFGEEERIRTGKKIVRTSLFSYGFLLAIDLILAAIKTLIT